MLFDSVLSVVRHCAFVNIGGVLDLAQSRQQIQAAGLRMSLLLMCVECARSRGRVVFDEEQRE